MQIAGQAKAGGITRNGLFVSARFDKDHDGQTLLRHWSPSAWSDYFTLVSDGTDFECSADQALIP